MNNLVMPSGLEISDHADESVLDLKRFKEITNPAESCLFDKKGAFDDIAAFGYPAYFLNHKTATCADLLWSNDSPDEEIPFLFGLYVLSVDHLLEYHVFTDRPGVDPSESFADQLATYCGTEGPIYVYGAVALRKSLSQLVKRFPVFTHYFESIAKRVVDLRVTARKRYWHPDLKGSWCLEVLAPVLFPEVNYHAQEVEMTLDLWIEKNAPTTSEWRKQEIENFIYVHCKIETYWLVMMRAAFLEGKKEYRGQIQI